MRTKLYLERAATGKASKQIVFLEKLEIRIPFQTALWRTKGMPAALPTKPSANEYQSYTDTVSTCTTNKKVWGMCNLNFIGQFVTSLFTCRIWRLLVFFSHVLEILGNDCSVTNWNYFEPKEWCVVLCTVFVHWWDYYLIECCLWHVGSEVKEQQGTEPFSTSVFILSWSSVNVLDFVPWIT